MFGLDELEISYKIYELFCKFYWYLLKKKYAT